MFYQQGDVLIKRMEEKVDYSFKKKLNHLILAEGEATGHKHQVISETSILYEDNGILFLHVTEDETKVVHEEHGVITLPKGDYKIGRVKEYDHFEEEVRNVKD